MGGIKPEEIEAFFAPSSSAAKPQVPNPHTALDAEVEDFFGGAPKPEVPGTQAPPPLQSAEELISMLNTPAPRDVTGMNYVPGPMPGESRVNYLRRTVEEYTRSGQAMRDYLDQTQSTISETPMDIKSRFRRGLANFRLLSTGGIASTEVNNSSGFLVGPVLDAFAFRPHHVAAEMVKSLPEIPLSIVRWPFYEVMDKVNGGQYLLPEEREQYRRESIANAAGLVAAYATGGVATELLVGRDLLKAGVSAALRREAAAAGITDITAAMRSGWRPTSVTTYELEQIAQTLPKALHYESTIPGQIKIGTIAGAAGGATTGILSGRTPEESRNNAAAYALMALPAGVAFEFAMGRIRGPRLGPNAATAAHAHGLSVLRQMQDAAAQNAQNARGSFLALRDASDLAEAAERADVTGPIIVQGVAKVDRGLNTLVHQRPDGLYDVAHGVPDTGEVPLIGPGEVPPPTAPTIVPPPIAPPDVTAVVPRVEVPPAEVGDVFDMPPIQMTDDVLRNAVNTVGVNDPRFSGIVQEAGKRFGDASTFSPEVQDLGERLDVATKALRDLRAQGGEDHPALPALEEHVRNLGRDYMEAVRSEVPTNNIVAMQRARSGIPPERLKEYDAQKDKIVREAAYIMGERNKLMRQGRDFRDEEVEHLYMEYTEAMEQLKYLPEEYRQLQVRRAEQIADFSLRKYNDLRRAYEYGSEQAEAARYEYLDKLHKVKETRIDYGIEAPESSAQQLEINALYQSAGIDYAPPTQPEFPFVRDPRVIAKLREIQDYFNGRLNKVQPRLPADQAFGAKLLYDVFDPTKLDENGNPVKMADRGDVLNQELLDRLEAVGYEHLTTDQGEVQIGPPPQGEELGAYLQRSRAENTTRDNLYKELADLIPIEELQSYFDPGTGLTGSHSADDAFYQALLHKRGEGGIGPHIVSMAKTGPGQVGAAMDRSLLKKLGANMYKSGIATVITKEAIQNMIDALRPKGGGYAHVDLSKIEQGIFVFNDAGTGMTPEVAANQFMDVGGSAKPGGASGGYGLAKVGLLSNAEHFKMETVADTPEGKRRTVIEGSSDDWINGTLSYKVEVVGKDIQTGTRLTIRVPKQMAEADRWKAGQFLENVIKYSRGVASNLTATGIYGDPLKDVADVREMVDIEDLPNATLEYHYAPKKVELGPYQQLPVRILNNGLYQFTIAHPARGNVPEFIVVDVKSKVDVENDNYPFTTSREELKSGVEKAVKEHVGKLALKAAKDEAMGLINTMRNSPRIPDTDPDVDLRVMDTSQDLSSETMQTVLRDPVTRLLAEQIHQIIHTLAHVMEGKRVQIGGHRTFTNFTFGGFGLGKSYIGLNISSSSLNELAKAAGIAETGFKNNVILWNPYTTYKEALAADALEPGAVPLRERLADHTIGTLVHELVHESARGHDEQFSSVLTRALGVVLETGTEARQLMIETWREALATYKSPLDPTPSFDETYEAVNKNWESTGDDAFKSISSDLASGADAPGSPERLPQAGEQPQARPSGTELSGVTGGATSASVRGSEALGFPTSGAPELPGAAERRRALAISTFEVSGFFPNEIVGFLGNEYHYVEPVIGTNGALEGHRIRNSDGEIAEVPWNMLRHGPDMAVNTFLFDKPAARRAMVDDFEKFLSQAGGLNDQPFDRQVAAYVSNRNLNQAMISPLTTFLSDEYGKRLRQEGLTPEENTRYERIAREVSKYREEYASNMVDLATTNGMYIEREAGALIIRESDTGAYLGLAHSPEEVVSFINNVVENRGADFTPGGIPPGVARNLIAPPPPPNGPHGSVWTPLANGKLGSLRDAFNVSSIGPHVTGMRQVLISLDNVLKKDLGEPVQLYERVYQRLASDHLRKYAAMHKDLTRLSETAKLARDLTPEQQDQITMSIETMHPDDIVKPGGLFPRGFTAREIAGANWLVQHQVDIKKAFQYYRGLKNLTGKPSYIRSTPEAKLEGVRKLQVSLGLGEAEIQAAKVFQNVLKKNDPANLSLYGIVRLAEAVMSGHMRPDDYITKYFPPADTAEGRKMRVIRDEVKSHFHDLASTFDIPDEQRLGGYFAHLRNFKNDEIIPGTRTEAPVFTSELLRTGEMSEYERDPISVLFRYINLGYSNKFTKAGIDQALKYVDEVTGKMKDPRQADYVRRLITENYIDEIRGIPKASTTFAEKVLNTFLDKIGAGGNISVRRDFINAFLSAGTSSLIGFNPAQGIRDAQNFASIYYSRFGAARLTNLMSTMARVTPKDLVQAGIIKKWIPGEGATAALAREGVIPTLGPVTVLTPEERISNSLASRMVPIKELYQRAGELGIYWGGQQNVYQWAHAASYLETQTTVFDVLTKLSRGEYGEGSNAKAKAYKKLFLNSYDPPVAEYFDRLVTEGKFKEAADILARATAFETVGTFGLANHPAGWGTNSGRLLGQLGSWAVWSRTMMTRMMTRGTKAERAAVAARWGMTQGGLALASKALGLNLNSWYLPVGGPLASAAFHLGAASQEYDDEQVAEVKRAAAAVMLGVPGSLMWRGSPAVGLAGSMIAASTGYPRAESEAYTQAVRLLSLPLPGANVIRNVLRATDMQEQGYNPVSAWLQGLGIPSTQEESMLNYGGLPKPETARPFIGY